MRIAPFATLLSLCGFMLQLASCQEPDLPEGDGSRLTPQSRPRAKAVADSPPVVEWLAPSVSLHEALRLTTPAGVELRQAAYLDRGIALLLRDYSRRTENQPDRQWCMLLRDTASPSLSPLEMPEGGLPSRLMSSASGSGLALLCWTEAAAKAAGDNTQSGDPAAAEATAASATPAEETDPVTSAEQAAASSSSDPTGFVVPTPNLTYFDWPSDAQPSSDSVGEAAQIQPAKLVARSIARDVIPVSVGGSGEVYLRPFAGARLEGGLITASCDWDATIQYWKPGTAAELSPATDPAILAAPGGRRAAGLNPALDPQRQAAVWQLFIWDARQGPASRLRLSLDVAAAAFPDESTTLAWLDDSQLAMVLPEATGADRVNWRLMTYDLKHDSLRLVADHLPARTPAAVTDGCLFYTRRDSSSGKWEVWASSLNGLDKRLLAAYSNTEALSLASTRPGRILILRQYFNSDVSTLHNSLIEFVVSPAGDWSISPEDLRSQASGAEYPLEFGVKPEPGVNPNAGGPDFVPDNPIVPEGRGDSSDRYRRRERGGQGSGGGTGGGGNGGPPDLSLPGL